MMKSLPLFFLILFFGNAINSAVFFCPKTLTTAKGTWHKTSGDHKGEYYYDFYANGTVVFRVLERFVPAVQSLITEARSTDGHLRLADPTIIYFDSSALIKDNFSVVRKSKKGDAVVVNPRNIAFSYQNRGCFGKRCYFVSFSEDGEDISISKGVYQVLQLARETALLQNNFVEIEMDLLKNKATGKKSLATLVPAPVMQDPRAPQDETLCVVCIDKAKNMMVKPCNHVCLCEDCSKTAFAACPMCQGPVASKEKIYY